MSFFCFCVIDISKNNNDNSILIKNIKEIAIKHKRGISDHITWDEPIISHFKTDSYIISINDSNENDNCEMLLLPDNWYVNGQTNCVSFRNRMLILDEISKMCLENNFNISFYIGQSGDDYDDFTRFQITQSELIQFLSETIGEFGLGIDYNIQISK